MSRSTLAAAALLFGGLLGLPTASMGQGSPVVVRVPVTGVIEMGLAPFIERSIREAEETGAAAIILDVDTPGGRVDAAERIADAISDSEVPIYAFVNRRAFSAGAMISLATQRIYMRPGSVIGAVTPVDGSGTKASEKIVSAMRSEMRALAEAHEVDPAIAEAMVDESLAIPDIVESGKLLTLTTEEAVLYDFARQTADFTSLLGELELAGAEVQTMRVNWAERLVRFFSHPVVAPFLLSLGFLGLIVEIKTPTFGLAGGAGVLALSLFFGSHLILGLAGWEELLLVGAGVGFLAAEVFVIPGFGLFGLLGIVGIFGGIYMSLLGSLPTMQDFSRAGGILSTAILLILVTGWALLRHLPKSTRLYRSGIFLGTRTDKAIGYQSAETRFDLVDAEGIAATDLRPSGIGLFDDERIDVVSESKWIEEGTPVRIVSAEGSRHVVRPVKIKIDEE
ncbi:MAG: NfeD family protein [Gemmatimonadota bacterium]|nr:NfeD family protein [Gemmatimonadota bacterium]